MKTGHLLALLMLAVTHASEAGLMASATRVIYEEGMPSKTVMIVNTNAWPVIVQSWVDNGEGDPRYAQAPFITLPVIFRLEPGASGGLRMVYNQTALPKDRESVFWLNLYEVPPLTAKSPEPSHLVLTINTQMKLFFRPKGLSVTPDQAIKKIQCKKERAPGQWRLACHNPTPVHISFTHITLTQNRQVFPAAPQGEMMASPFSSLTFAVQGNVSSAPGDIVTLNYRDDFGAEKSADLPLID